jgi:hypothetical protein
MPLYHRVIPRISVITSGERSRVPRACASAGGRPLGSSPAGAGRGGPGARAGRVAPSRGAMRRALRPGPIIIMPGPSSERLRASSPARPVRRRLQAPRYGRGTCCVRASEPETAAWCRGAKAPVDSDAQPCPAAAFTRPEGTCRARVDQPWAGPVATRACTGTRRDLSENTVTLVAIGHSPCSASHALPD